MKKPIRFLTHHEQKHRESYWLSRSPEERLAELVRLRRKAFWKYYSNPNPEPETKTLCHYTIAENETLEQFFARVVQERRQRNF